MTSVTWQVNGPEETRALGRALATQLLSGDLLILSGGLGAGKTTFTQGIGQGLGVRGQVASPTFVIARVHPTLGQGPDLVHADAYRLSSIEELDALDLDVSLASSVTVVEWGEDKAEVLSADRLEIEIRRPAGQVHLPVDLAAGVDLTELDAGQRTVIVTPVGQRWAGIDLSKIMIDAELGQS